MIWDKRFRFKVTHQKLHDADKRNWRGGQACQPAQAGQGKLGKNREAFALDARGQKGQTSR